MRYSDGKIGVAQVKATTTTMYASAVSAAKPLPPYVSTPAAPSPTPLPVLGTLTTTGTHSFTGKFDNATDQWQHFRYSIVQGESVFCLPAFDTKRLEVTARLSGIPSGSDYDLLFRLRRLDGFNAEFYSTASSNLEESGKLSWNRTCGIDDVSVYAEVSIARYAGPATTTPYTVTLTYRWYLP